MTKVRSKDVLGSVRLGSDMSILVFGSVRLGSIRCGSDQIRSQNRVSVLSWRAFRSQERFKVLGWHTLRSKKHVSLKLTRTSFQKARQHFILTRILVPKMLLGSKKARQHFYADALLGYTFHLYRILVPKVLLGFKDTSTLLQWRPFGFHKVH